ncbi:MAG: amidohydrolase family protein [Bdellovibrionota bacterium]
MTLKKPLLLVASILSGAFLWFLLKKPLPEYDCLLLLNSKYFDYKTSAYVANKTIVIKNAVIADIFDTNPALTLNTTCKLLNLKGAFLYPGLIDSHAHLLALDKQKVPNWKTALELSAARPEKTRLLIGEANAKSMLLAGFTTIRDLGNSGFHLDAKLKKIMSAGPEIITSGPGVAIAPSQIDLKHNPKEYNLVDEHTDIDLLLQNYKSHQASWIKLYADNSNKSPLMAQSLLKSLTQKARNLNLRVAIHAEYAQSIANALDAEPDSVEHFYEIPLSKKTRAATYAVLTDAAPLEKTSASEKRISWLKQNNVKIVFGSDAVLDFTSNFKNRGEASLSSLIRLRQIGLSPQESLLSATATAGEMLGLPIGKIEKNYAANLVVFNSDPLLSLENLKNRTLIIFGGKIVCDNRQVCSP